MSSIEKSIIVLYDKHIHTILFKEFLKVSLSITMNVLYQEKEHI